jgi:flagellar hook-basal body complex protein FliE
MADLFAQGVRGYKVNLETTNPRHIQSKLHPEDPTEKANQSFSSVLTGKLEGVNELIHTSTGLTQQFITDPDSVDVHDVTIAMGKANLAVSLTKSVVDGALRAYREIVNLR